MKKIIIVTEENAVESYNQFEQEVKDAISKHFKIPVTDRIKTFEDACKELGISQRVFNKSIEYDTPDEIAYKKMKVIAKALNEGWEPNWDDPIERKWRPWFYLDSPGFRFIGSDYALTSSHSAGCSRLCFKSQELCNYAAKQFLDIYKDLFN